MELTVPTALPQRVFVDDLAKAIGLSKFTIYHWLKTDSARLPPAYRQGSRVCFRIEDAREWMESQLVPYQPGGLAFVRRENVELANKKRGRPTKAETVAKRLAAAGAAS